MRKGGTSKTQTRTPRSPRSPRTPRTPRTLLTISRTFRTPRKPNTQARTPRTPGTPRVAKIIIKNRIMSIDTKIKSPVNTKCIENNRIKFKSQSISIDTNKVIGFGGNSIILEGSSRTNTYVVKLIYSTIDKKSETEVAIMKKTSLLLDSKQTRHLIKIYHNMKCKNNQINIKSQYDGQQDDIVSFNYLILMKKYSGHIVQLLFGESTLDTKKNIYSQVYLSLITFHSFLNILHDDVKLDNFFYELQNVDSNEYYEYILVLNGNQYYLYLKKINYSIVIGDYGESKVVSTKKDLLQDFSIIEELGQRNRFFQSRDFKLAKDCSTYQEYILNLIHNTDLFSIGKPYANIVSTFTINIDQQLGGKKKKYKNR